MSGGGPRLESNRYEEVEIDDALDGKVDSDQGWGGGPRLYMHSDKSPARPMLFYSTNYWQQF